MNSTSTVLFDSNTTLAFFGIAIFGVIGNVVVILVLTRGKASSHKIYLVSMAAIDIIITLHMGILANFGPMKNPTACKVHYYTASLELLVSMWMRVAITIERYLVVKFPFKTRQWFSPEKAKITIGTIVAGLVLVNLLSAWAFQGDGTRNVCSETIDGELYLAGSLLLAILYAIVPLFTIFTFNTLNVIHLVKSHRKKKAMTSKHSRANDQLVHITIMTVTSVAVYAILTTPVAIILIMKTAYLVYGMPFNSDLATFYDLATLAVIINHNINFVVYILSGKVFREEFKKLVCCQKAT